MQPSLGLFFSVLLTRGASLECETCSKMGHNCTGQLQACNAGQDVCAIILSETSLGLKVRRIVKFCEYSHFCRNGPATMHAGLEKAIRSIGACCVGDACRDLTLKLPQSTAEFNGKKCPACYSVSNKCRTEVVDCVGQEDYCFDTIFHTAHDEWNTTLKGCTTKAACMELNRKNISLGGFLVRVEKIACELAGKSPPSFGYPFLAVFGLLLKKIF